MKNKLCFKKSVSALVIALVAVMGVFGVSAVTAWATEAVVNTEGINVRRAAVDGEAVDTLPEGQSVTIVDTITGSDGNTWDQITYSAYGSDDLGGWVRADFLTTTGDAVLEEEEIAEEAAEDAAEDAEDAAQEAITSEEAAEAAMALEEDEEQEPVASSSGGVSYVISSSIPSDMIPDGFQRTTVSYEGKDVAALVMNSAEVYLLYMEDTSKTAPGRLVVYDVSKAELIPYICFDTDDGFILLLNIPDAELTSVSDRFVLTTCAFDSGTMDALQMTQKDSIISESANLTEFYFMYGVNRDGMYGWYVYNSAEGMIEANVLSMHYNLNGTSVGEEEERSGFSLDSLSTIVIVGIIVIFLLLLILVIIFGVRYRQLANEMDSMDMRSSSKRSSGSSGSKGKSTRSDRGSTSTGTSTRSSTRSKVSQNTQKMDVYDEIDSDPYGGSSTTDHLRNDASEQQTRRNTRPPQNDSDSDDDDLTFL